MKFNKILLFLFLVSSSAAQGIEFEDGDLASALAKAREQNKLIFVDAFTTWCGPCKAMSKNIFTDPEVGTFFNESFINMKIDMERGEGIDLAKTYEVKAYPSLLFINADGKLVHESVGFRPVSEFLDLGAAAKDPERQISTMAQRYLNGERSVVFLKKYVAALTSAGVQNFEEVTQLYMDQQSDWKSKENIKFLFDYSDATMDSKLFQYSIDNRELFIAVVGKEKYYQKMDYAADLDRSKAGIAREDVEKLKEHYSKYYPKKDAENKAKMSYFNQLMYSPDRVDQEKFIAEIQLFLAGNPEVGSNFYNAVAWQIYEFTSDTQVLRKAAIWAEKSIELNKNSFNTDTLAALLFKLGNNKEARQFALESIELAKKEGNDYSATTELLSKIELK